jgi:cytochrome c peroxidase
MAIRAMVWIASLALLDLASAQVGPPPPVEPVVVPANQALDTLKKLPLPPVVGLDQYIANTNAAIRLGKALFWDQNVGSDGGACASCHFHAGADHRTKHQLSPGLKGGNGVFDFTTSGNKGPNIDLTSADYPFHRLADTGNRNSPVLFDTDDVTSSQGVSPSTFLSVAPGGKESVTNLVDALFSSSGKLVRRVEPRNTPTMINAAYNFRNFWDGRANNNFNGANPFGPRDVNAGVLALRPDGTVEKVRVALTNSSLASQACGPPLSDFEMSAAQKQFPDLGLKLMPQRALASQMVHANDSVLGGSFRHSSGLGLNETYQQLIQAAFKPKFWSAAGRFSTGAGTNTYSQMEMNFSLFFGLAIQTYEETLISNDAPIDRFFEGQPGALTTQQIEGMNIFNGPAGCFNCHRGPLLTGATIAIVPGAALDEVLVERMVMGDGNAAIYDNAYYNIGVRPTFEDLGVGGKDPFGNDLSFGRQYLDLLRGNKVFDPLTVNPCFFALPFDPLDCSLHPNPWTARVAVDGCFKTPSLRNVELTGPYFHNGGQATLEQVVEFYNRGGDSRGLPGADTSGFGPNPSNLDPDIAPLFLTDAQKAALVAFLKSLTDDRVRLEKAPFDHPQLVIPHGHSAADANQDGRADDINLVLPPVGAAGRAAEGLGPLNPFLQP